MGVIYLPILFFWHQFSQLQNLLFRYKFNVELKAANEDHIHIEVLIVVWFLAILKWLITISFSIARIFSIISYIFISFCGCRSRGCWVEHNSSLEIVLLLLFDFFKALVIKNLFIPCVNLNGLDFQAHYLLVVDSRKFLVRLWNRHRSILQENLFHHGIYNAY